MLHLTREHCLTRLPFSEIVMAHLHFSGFEDVSISGFEVLRSNDHKLTLISGLEKGTGACLVLMNATRQAAGFAPTTHML